MTLHKRSSKAESEPLLGAVGGSRDYSPKRRSSHGKVSGARLWMNRVLMLALLTGFGGVAYYVYSLTIGGGSSVGYTRANTPAYYLVHNAVVHTVDDNQPKAEAFVVQNGQFVDVGKSGDLIKKHPKAVKINLGGKMVVPGLIDSHAHLVSFGRFLIAADLKGSLSPAEVRSKLKNYLKMHPEITPESGTWLTGLGWDQTKWPSKEFPSFRDLDDPILSKLPIVLTRVDGHAVWINEAALKLVVPSLPSDWSMDGGEIVVDESGRPTGVFIDDAIAFVTKSMSNPSLPELLKYVEVATQAMVKAGLTGMHDAGVSLEELNLFKTAIAQDAFPIRNYAMVMCPPTSDSPCAQGLPPAHLPAPLEAPTSQSSNLNINKLIVRSVKMVSDGALGSWGAAMVDAYSDAPGKTGLLRLPRDTLHNLIARVWEQGYQVNIHAIGDFANQVVLDGFQGALEKMPEGKAKRNRIEHSQILRKMDVKRFGELGILPSVQPTHATSDMSYALSRLGPERCSTSYLWQTFIQDPLVPHLPLGSDFPIEDVNPMKGIYAAVTRRFENGSVPHGWEGEKGWYPKEMLTREQALKGFTLSAAYASFMEDLIGSIAPRKLADFVVFPLDWLDASKVPDLQILKQNPVATVVGGRVEYGKL
ncbi:hypothetical protein HDV05_006052 [Chytridiales sp. JEL 0842]|nr:hypothetical protein HDV05_006052 [Chytridiales sp. JEL 0842]